jgi:hypothetical protein
MPFTELRGTRRRLPGRLQKWHTSLEAKNVYEALLKEGALDSIALRKLPIFLAPVLKAASIKP